MNTSPSRCRLSILSVGLALIVSACSASAADTSIDVTYAFWGNEKWGSDPNDSYATDFGKKFGINLKPVAMSWSDWNDKLKLWAATDTLPDIFPFEQPYFQWAKQGLLKGIPVATLKAKYPNILRYVSPGILEALTIDGKLYGIPRGHWDLTKHKALDLSALYVQTSFLKKAGLTAPPDTLDGWVSFLGKAVKEDYSGTGKTIGMNTLSSLLMIRPFNPEHDYWMKEDGRWIPSYLSRKNLAALQFMRKLYQEGILAADFMITARLPETERIALFTKGIMAAQLANGDPDMIDNNFITSDAPAGSANGEFITLALPPKSADGKRYFPASPNYWTYTGISARVDDVKLDRILQLLDFDASPEGRLYGVYGVEGKDYKLESGQIVSLLPKDEKTGKQKKVNEVYPSADLARFLITWDLEAAMTNPNHSAEIRKKSADYFAAIAREATIVEPNWRVELLSTPAKDEMPNIAHDFYDMLYRVVASKADVTKAYNDWVALEMEKIGAAIAEVNAAIK